MTEAERAAEHEEAKWVTHACFFACGGRCVNQSLVRKGRVICQRTDESHPDAPDYPQQRGCARGRSLKQMIFSADRLKCPMKRVHWAPGGGDKSLRGRDEWEPVSWEEALGLIADETRRIKETYGNRSILTTGYEYRNVYPGQYSGAALNAFGGCVTTWGQASKGGFPVVTSMMKGAAQQGSAGMNDRYQLLNAKLIVLWAINSAWSQAGNTTYFYRLAKDRGAKIIVVDSWYTPTAQALADEWVPVRPGTDTALLLALAYCLIEEGLFDQNFLDRYCVGFDARHMPQGHEWDENFHDYVLGRYDGVPKTPEWASEICGTSAEMIRSLAHEMGSVKPMTMRSSYAPARTYEGARFAQAFYTVGWMTGNVGVPGAEVSVCAIANPVIFGGTPLIQPGAKGFRLPENPICSQPRGNGSLGRGEYKKGAYYGIAMSEVWDAVITGKHTHFTDGVVDVDIRMIWKMGDGGRMNQNPDFTKAVEAYRKVDFAVASDLWMTPDCQYSDIVLPATSLWERFGTIMPQTNREVMIYSSQVCPPLFDTRDDLWMEAELCRRWGIDPRAAQPITDREVIFNQLYGAAVCHADGSRTPLLSFDREALAFFGAQAREEQRGALTWQEFSRTGVYQIPRHEGDEFSFLSLADFRRNPDGCPVKTLSGRLEICCPALVEKYDEFSLSGIDAIAKYVPARGGYEDSFSDWAHKVKGPYPFQLISIHHIRRAHQAYDQLRSLRRLFPCELLMNDGDGARLGIENEDAVEVESACGRLLRHVSLSPLVMPGVVILGEGGWAKMSRGVDVGGNANTLSRGTLCGEGQQPWNTTLVRVKKADCRYEKDFEQ